MVHRRLLAQGWYADPFGRHDARWFSDGIPTKLVRDGKKDSLDQVPSRRLTEDPTPICNEPRCDDMKRADSQDTGSFDPVGMTQAVFTAMVRMGD